MGKSMQLCKECGSENIFYDAFVNVNDPDHVRIYDQVYCEECEKFVQTKKQGE
jgi:formylmethanofuran dehydrogenase subunit E